MIKRIYIVSVKDYDYFDRFRHNANDGQKIYEFESFSEAFKFYKESRSKDFYWEGDHERSTSFKTNWVFIKETQEKHGRVFGHKPTEEDLVQAFLDYLPW